MEIFIKVNNKHEQSLNIQREKQHQQKNTNRYNGERTEDGMGKLVSVSKVPLSFQQVRYEQPRSREIHAMKNT